MEKILWNSEGYWPFQNLRISSLFNGSRLKLGDISESGRFDLVCSFEDFVFIFKFWCMMVLSFVETSMKQIMNKYS